MRPLAKLLTAAAGAFALMLAWPFACGGPARTSWSQGNFKVYATDLDHESTTLGYDHHPGLLGLVEAEVVAAGGDDRYVVVEREDPPTGRTEFFVVSKGSTGDSWNGSVEGPFARAQFEEMRAARGLPAFTWRKDGRH